MAPANNPYPPADLLHRVPLKKTILYFYVSVTNTFDYFLVKDWFILILHLIKIKMDIPITAEFCVESYVIKEFFYP